MGHRRPGEKTKRNSLFSFFHSLNRLQHVPFDGGHYLERIIFLCFMYTRYFLEIDRQFLRVHVSLK